MQTTTNNSMDRLMSTIDKLVSKTGLVPMTYDEAAKMFLTNGRRSFSFIAAPYGVPKTVVVGNYNGALAVTPDHLYTQEGAR